MSWPRLHLPARRLILRRSSCPPHKRSRSRPHARAPSLSARGPQPQMEMTFKSTLESFFLTARDSETRQNKLGPSLDANYRLISRTPFFFFCRSFRIPLL